MMLPRSYFVYFQGIAKLSSRQHYSSFSHFLPLRVLSHRVKMAKATNVTAKDIIKPFICAL